MKSLMICRDWMFEKFSRFMREEFIPYATVSFNRFGPGLESMWLVATEVALTDVLHDMARSSRSA